jgi:hypothetical protein
MDYFAEQGFRPEDSDILAVGANLIGWYLKDQYPEATVETLEVEERTAEVQDSIGGQLSDGADPESLRDKVSSYNILDPEEECGAIYPDIITEIGNRASEPDASYVMCFSDFEGEADLIISNNVGDFLGRKELLHSAERADVDFLEMYSTTIAPEPVISDVARHLSLDPDFSPDLDFYWAPDEEVTYSLFT